MTLADYLEHITAKVKRDLDRPMAGDLAADMSLLRSREHILDLFSQSHLFNLGEAEDINRAVVELGNALDFDLSQGVPAPFDNMMVMFEKDGRWSFEWHLRMKPYVKHLPSVGEAKDLRLLVDLSQIDSEVPAFSYSVLYDVIPGPDGNWAIRSYGGGTDRAMRLQRTSRAEATEAMGHGLRLALGRLALISHPSNYVVRTSPRLTPREERRFKERGETPPRKRPYYIVIDHSDLLALNPRGPVDGGHRSPLPHARRGHWMRLAERCRAAREAGKERVWVRETYVGEREFEDEKNRYLVMVGRGQSEAKPRTTDSIGSSNLAGPREG